MRRIWTAAILLSATLAAQDPFGIADLLMETLEQNTRTAAVTPSAAASIAFSLRQPTLMYDTIYVGLQDPRLAVTLRTPSGALVTGQTAAQSGLKWETLRATEKFALRACPSATQWISIEIPKDRRGDYVVQAQAPRNVPRATLCATHIGANWPFTDDTPVEIVGADVRTDHPIYQLGDLVTISVPVRDGANPVRGARVSATVSTIDNVAVGPQVATLALADPDGDGFYSATWQPSQPDHYYVAATISGRDRRQTGRFQVVPVFARLRTASLSGTAAHPRAVMTFDVTVAGEYRVTPTLRGANGRTTNGQISVDLPPGSFNVTWNVPDYIQSFQAPLELTSVHVVRTNPQAQFGADYVGEWVPDGAGGWHLK